MRERIDPDVTRAFEDISGLGPSGIEEVEALERMLSRRITCHAHLVGAERGARAYHGPALWRLTLEPCLTVQHERARGVVCDPCARWLQRSLRKYVSRECSVAWFCPQCRRTADVVRDHTLVRL
ncbi:Uncharacterised protein (plasmid) [Tsukamurella tyrosinosolvens]|uniref:Uncharacterized protein n=1 Tax=Tsukamurella tyrosinosolvens TaxID=57704 RepID=A0A1H4VRY3_TSUTY|nr:hypothetical protein [Tsukamurella tyrosinosolvens]KXO90912.1 hypothetical protein AXK58_20990 [Tsukamurella tyrosinosolvens]SEC83288.1 hypothetical protein SAMN04489793_3304 [Tsukamurella tyrosinosolvens]VEH90364.1 Uncharacterised protein [Tsukamurella tyrosinosolvens]